MSFDERARRAAQGIHRAVEVMEMSSTKTPQRLTRFDEYRTRTSRGRRIVAIAVGVGVPLLIVIAAVRILGSKTDPKVPLEPPAPSPSQSASPTPVSGSTDVFEAPFTYTLPPGWTVAGESKRYFGLLPPQPERLTGMLVLSSVGPARSDCSDHAEQGVGRSSDAMTTWLSTHPALDATEPQEVTLGGATGSWVDVQLAEDWSQSCMNGLTLVTGRPDDREAWAINGNERIRLYVLDLPAGDTVTIVIGVWDAADFNDVIDEAAPVVESFEFPA